jgi:ESS family glutamate:Na+ symporter
VALAYGAHPFYGLLAGGLSFVGGPGTALAWAREAEAAGLEVAPAVGIGAATLATIAGALFAGPISGLLISRYGLRPRDRSPSGVSFAATEQAPATAIPPASLAPTGGLEQILLSLLMVTVSVYLGEIIFRLLGRDYDAAVTTAGFLGFGLASMPVAMATMDEVARRYGPSPKAFLVITLAGAFFVDLANASMARLFLLLPMFSLG